jgi:hypothetical protein
LPESLFLPERWPALPAPLRDFVVGAVQRCRATPSLVRLAAGGSFETLDMLAFLRERVLGPMALEAAGARPTGVRRVESAAPQAATRLREVVAGYDPADCARALSAAASLYRKLRAEFAAPGLVQRDGAEAGALEYLAEIEAKLARGDGPAGRAEQWR